MIAALFSTAHAFSDQKIDESVKFNNADEGIIVSIGADAIDYLKTQYLPYVYDKVKSFNLPEFDFKDGAISGKVKAKVTLPEPE